MPANFVPDLGFHDLSFEIVRDAFRHRDSELAMESTTGFDGFEKR